MAKSYSKYLSTLDIPSSKTIIITGGNSGIGFAVAKYLLQYDWHIIIATRNLGRGEDAKNKLIAIKEDAKVDVYQLDVSSRLSINKFAKNIIDAKIDVDCFYANAGAYRIPYQESEEGFEMTFATNYIGNILLYEAFKDYFQSLGHVVKFIQTSSVLAHFGHAHEIDLYGGKKYHKAKAYAKSKIAVNMFHEELCRIDTKNILPLLVHPGVTYTPLIEKAYHGKRFQLAANRFLRLFTHTVDKAALSTLYLLQPAITSSCFCGPRGLFHIAGYPRIYPLYRGNIKKGRAFVAYTKDKLGIK